MRCAKLRPHGKIGVGGTVTNLREAISERENVFVLVFIGMTLV